MKQKIKDFFLALWHFVSYPFVWLSVRKVDKKLARSAANDKANVFTEKDVEFLKSVGIETDLNTLKSSVKK